MKNQNLVRDRGAVQNVQTKCHIPVYLIKNLIYSFLETLLILELKLYFLRKLINVKKRDPKKVE